MSSQSVNAPPLSPTPVCPDCGEPIPAAGVECDSCAPGKGPRFEFWSIQEMRYPSLYVWLVFLSTLDVLLTMFVIFLWSGREVNPIAAAVIDTLGFGWAIVFKYAIAILVILICEAVGRSKDRTGRMLGWFAISLNAAAVGYTFALLLLAGPADLINVESVLAPPL